MNFYKLLLDVWTLLKNSTLVGTVGTIVFMLVLVGLMGGLEPSDHVKNKCMQQTKLEYDHCVFELTQ